MATRSARLSLAISITIPTCIRAGRYRPAVLWFSPYTAGRSAAKERAAAPVRR
jgi:hypothetical protein